jgi:carboxyl-terminal processing protease
MQRWILQPAQRQMALLAAVALLAYGAVYEARAQESSRRSRLTAPATQAPSLSAPRPTQPIAIQPATDPRVARWIEEGQELESESKWAEAAGHYEEALKELPENSKLRDRWNLARAHCDVARRHSDPEYVRWARSISRDEALSTYGEILQKIHSNYVGAPTWPEIVREGTRFLLVSLDEPPFLTTHALKNRAAQVDSFRNELKQRMATYAPTSREEAKACADDAARLAQSRLGIPAAVMILEFAAASSGTLDEYSAFLAPTQLDELFSQIEGNFVGLGVEIKTEADCLQIVDVIAGSPAEKVGLKRSDRIVAVDGHHTRDEHPDAVADFLRGPEGSEVEVVVRLANDQEKTFYAVRQRVEVPCIDRVQIIDQDAKVGYLRLTNFQKSTSRDLDSALWKLHREGMQSLVLDLRGNPGGLLDAAVKVADKFIRDGKIVSTRGRSPREDFDYHAIPEGTWPVPLVVLIDGDSASASEIFAGAIRDHHRGVIVGSRSYGKGSVQGIFPLSTSKAGVRLTTSRFFSPSGKAISGNGVEPNVRVEIAAKPNDEGEVLDSSSDDLVLDRGINEARVLAAPRQQVTRASK